MFADAEEVVRYVNSCGVLGSVQAAEPLSGGAANYVFRLRFAAHCEPRTAVLKHYAPSLKSNSTVAFSQERYFVEKSALITLAAASWPTTVRVPRVLHADDDNKVLVMEDIGEGCVSLMEFFSNGHVRDMAPEHLGSQLASFLAGLYALDTAQLPECFHNTAAWDVLDRRIHQRFQENLTSLGVLPELSHWVPLAQPAREPNSAVLIMGDLWPNAVYINPKTQDIWLLDWELARLGGPLSDVRQMLANLFMMEHGPAGKFAQDEVARFRKALVQGVMSAVGQLPGAAEQADFMVLLAAIINNEFWQVEAPGNLMQAASAGCAAYLQCA